MWSKGKVMESTQYLINSLPFASYQWIQQCLRYSYFKISPWKIQGQCQGRSQRIIWQFTQYPVISMTGRGGVGAGWGLVCGWWAATKLWSDLMSGSHFIVQTSNFFHNQCHGRGGHVEVTDGPSWTFPQTYTFFVPNIWGLAQTVLISEAKVVAAADAAADPAAETNLKHKVTPCKLKNISIAHNSDLLLDHKNSLPVAISAFLGTCINKGN